MAAEQAGLTDLDGQEIDSNWDEVTKPVTRLLRRMGC